MCDSYQCAFLGTWKPDASNLDVRQLIAVDCSCSSVGDLCPFEPERIFNEVSQYASSVLTAS